jgi:hypothetical protein
MGSEGYLSRVSGTLNDLEPIPACVRSRKSFDKRQERRIDPSSAIFELLHPIPMSQAVEFCMTHSKLSLLPLLHSD